MNLSAGILQFCPALGAPAENISKISRLLDRLPACRLIVMPELANSGYNFISAQQAYSSSEPLPTGEFTAFLLEEARQRNCYIVAGVNERDGDKLFNTAIIAGPDGLAGKYRKIHLFMNEKDIFSAGEEMPQVYQLDGFKLGIQICFDYLFPETWRHLASNGAEVICHPSNLITENAYRTLPAQALMNKVFIVTANRTGTERDLTFCGRSIVHGPAGEVVYKGHSTEDETALVSFDTRNAMDKQITRRNHVFNDRRPELYG